MKTKRPLVNSLVLFVLLSFIFILPGAAFILTVLALVGIKVKKLKKYTKGLGWGLVALFFVYLVSFYIKSHVVGEFDDGGTWVPDHGFLTAINYFFQWSTAFMAAFFGFSSNGTYGDNNSNTLYIVGAILSALIVMVGRCISILVHHKDKK